MTEEITKEFNPEEYKTFNLQLTLNIKEILNKEIESIDEAKAFIALVEVFFGSDVVIKQFTEFVRFYMNPQPEIIVPESKIILPS